MKQLKASLIIAISVICLICGSDNGASIFAQTTICAGDTALLILNSYRGSIQWQESYDSIAWTDIPGETSDSVQIIIDTTTWYRAEVIEGTCQPVYSSIEKFISFCCGTDSVHDADGNWYQTVQIGTQCWFKESMRTTKYPDSTAITKGPAAYGAAGWTTDLAQYSCPPNSSNNGEDCAAAVSLGMLYQWSAAMYGSTTEGAQGVCPTGWHVPTDSELKTLEGSLGMTVAEQDLTGWRGTNEGSKMANHVADQNWFAGTLTGDANFASSGFDLGPSGQRNKNGTLSNRGGYANLWTSTVSGTYAWNRYPGSLYTTVNRDADNKAYVFSVRCLKD